MTSAAPSGFFEAALIESEAVGNRHIADYLTGIGHPTTPEDSYANFMGLSGPQFIGAVEEDKMLEVRNELWFTSQDNGFQVVRFTTPIADLLGPAP